MPPIDLAGTETHCLLRTDADKDCSTKCLNRVGSLAAGLFFVNAAFPHLRSDTLSTSWPHDL